MEDQALLNVPSVQAGDEAQWANKAELALKSGDVRALLGLLAQTPCGGGAGYQAEVAAFQHRLCQLYELEPLHVASANGHREMVRFLLEQIAPWLTMVNDKEGGATALHVCARFGRLEIAGDLLGCGALVCSPDSGGCTALHVACEHNNDELVRLLLDAGSPVNSRDKIGCTPLFTSVRAGGSPGVLRLLTDRGADVDAAPDGEPTALALASGMGCLEAVRQLASAGADLTAASKNLGGETALHLAAKNGSHNVLCFLLSAGCWAEMRDTDGRTPLASACAGGRTGTAATILTGEGWCLDHIPHDVPPELRRYVLSFLVASLEEADHSGNTPLLAACEHRGTPELLDLLVAHSADFSHTNRCGETALHVASRRGNVALARYLLECETLSRATRTFCVEASVDATDARGRRPGEVRDIDVGVHEAMAVREVIERVSM